MMVGFYVVVAIGVAVGALPWPALLALLGIERLVRAWPYMTGPRPDEPPKDFPVWPLWYAAVAFVHLRRPVALLVAGLFLAAVFNISIG
jgi:1,4-dihydroxy-2-naphthoate octaprenyltransferase